MRPVLDPDLESSGSEIFGLRDRDPDPPLFHIKLRNIFYKSKKKVSQLVMITHTIHEELKKLKISAHLCIHINQN